MNTLMFGPPEACKNKIMEAVFKECASVSSDVHFFMDEGSTLGVDVAGAIEDVIKDYPVGAKHYVIVSDLKKSTVDFQNMLLKSLEDARFVDFYLISSTEEVLDTVRSRCKCKRIGMGLSEYLLKYKGNHPVESYFLTDGDLDGVAEREDIELFLSVKEALLFDPKQIYSLLHLVREKDKEYFYGTHTEQVSGLVCYIHFVITEALLSDKGYRDAFGLTVTEIRRCKSGIYTKDAFYVFLANLVNALLLKGAT